MAFFAPQESLSFFYTDQGTGPAVLLLHGWACDSHDWSWQIPALRDAGYRVIAMDQRGHGRSSAPEGDYGPEALADDAALLLDTLGVQRAVVIGHSMGTVVASALSVRRPDLVGRLILVDPVYLVTEDSIRPMLAALAGEDPCGAAGRLFRHAFYTPDTPEALITWHERRVLGTPAHVVRGCIDGLFGQATSIGRAHVAATYLTDRKAPTLAVYARDETTSLDRRLLNRPVDLVTVIPGGHFLHQQRAEDFNSLMLRWLAGA